MSRKFLVGIGFAFAAIFAVAVAAVMGASSLATAPVQPVAAPETAPVPVVAVQPTPAPTPDAPIKPMATAPAELHSASAPIGSNYTVQDSDIAPLADAVKLNERCTGIGKEVWARETPIAQKLLAGLCDCDQRNWLKHYVETGQKAMAGSADYPDSIQVLSQLRRSNADLGKGFTH